MTDTAAQPEKPRPKAKNTKPKATRAAQLRKMLVRKNGATIAQLQLAFGWKPHAARAAKSSLRKAGTSIERISTEKGSRYRIDQQGDKQ